MTRRISGGSTRAQQDDQEGSQEGHKDEQDTPGQVLRQEQAAPAQVEGGNERHAQGGQEEQQVHHVRREPHAEKIVVHLGEECKQR